MVTLAGMVVLKHDNKERKQNKKSPLSGMANLLGTHEREAVVPALRREKPLKDRIAHQDHGR